MGMKVWVQLGIAWKCAKSLTLQLLLSTVLFRADTGSNRKIVKNFEISKQFYATFNLENLNLINNSNVNAKNVYFSKIKPITPSFSIFDL